MNNELFVKMITDSWQQQINATNKIFDNLSDDPVISKWAKDLHEEFGLTFFPEKGREIIERFGLTP